MEESQHKVELSMTPLDLAMILGTAHGLNLLLGYNQLNWKQDIINHKCKGRESGVGKNFPLSNVRKSYVKAMYFNGRVLTRVGNCTNQGTTETRIKLSMHSIEYSPLPQITNENESLNKQEYILNNIHDNNNWRVKRVLQFEYNSTSLDGDAHSPHYVDNELSIPVEFLIHISIHSSKLFLVANLSLRGLLSYLCNLLIKKEEEKDENGAPLGDMIRESSGGGGGGAGGGEIVGRSLQEGKSSSTYSYDILQAGITGGGSLPLHIDKFFERGCRKKFSTFDDIYKVSWVPIDDSEYVSLKRFSKTIWRCREKHDLYDKCNMS
ncbi:hypothetical protein LguiA_029808 [Lonicera macranthoides]